MRSIFPFLESAGEFSSSLDSAGKFYKEVENSVSEFLLGHRREEFWLDCLDEEREEGIGEGWNDSFKVALVLCVGVAAFLVFCQRNITG